jgi:NTE family protein
VFGYKKINVVSLKVPDKQRVLILQGGGALGAYQVGAFKALYEEISRIDAENGSPGRPLFDIVAGTSIGAINAAILVSYVKENNGKWDGAYQKLREFWDYISFDPKDEVELWIRWWKEDHRNDPNAASAEAARRYYSARFFLKNGAPHVFSSPELVSDDKFFDNCVSFPNNLWYRYNNDRLRESISDRQFTKFPISTHIGEPRLLVVSTDIGHGSTVTFDSYSQESRYGRIDKRSGKYIERQIKYERGIEVSHVMASSCIPLFYNYEEIQGRKLWDGGILSNTPLREVLHMHRAYWLNTEGGKHKNKVPNLEVYIISVWPSKDNNDKDDGDAKNVENVPNDFDGLKAKLYDIGLSDKTAYDEKVSIMVSDYVKIVESLRDFATNYMDIEKKDAFTKDLKVFLEKEKVQSKTRDGKQRTFASLLDGRFKIEGEIVRIEMRQDINGIANRAFDLSPATIEILMTNGEKDARKILSKIPSRGQQ